VVLLAGEVAFTLHRAVVLALGLVQDDAHPFSRGEEGGAHVGYGAPLALTDDLHHGADLGQKEWRKRRGGGAVSYYTLAIVITLIKWLKRSLFYQQV